MIMGHEHDDYIISVYPSWNIMINTPICTYCTIKFLRAVRMYFKYSREFPQATIVFKHTKYS